MVKLLHSTVVVHLIAVLITLFTLCLEIWDKLSSFNEMMHRSFRKVRKFANWRFVFCVILNICDKCLLILRYLKERSVRSYVEILSVLKINFNEVVMLVNKVVMLVNMVVILVNVVVMLVDVAVCNAVVIVQVEVIMAILGMLLVFSMQRLHVKIARKRGLLSASIAGYVVVWVTGNVIVMVLLINEKVLVLIGI